MTFLSHYKIKILSAERTLTKLDYFRVFFSLLAIGYYFFSLRVWTFFSHLEWQAWVFVFREEFSRSLRELAMTCSAMHDWLTSLLASLPWWTSRHFSKQAVLPIWKRMNNTTTQMGSETAKSQLWQGVTLIVTDLLILFLNFCAMFIIYRFKQKLIPDVLIFSLACADLMKGIFPIPMTIGVYMGWWKLAEGTLGCKLFAWTGFTTNSGAMLVLTLMSCDRYIAICWPFEYKSRISVRKVSYIVAGIYIFVGIHSLLPVVGIGGVASFHKDTFCHFDFEATDQASKAYSIYILVLGFSMLVLVIFNYSRSMCKVRGLIQRSQRRMSAMAKRKSQCKEDAAINRMNYMFARMMLVLMISFLISWLLFMVSKV